MRKLTMVALTLMATSCWRGLWLFPCLVGSAAATAVAVSSSAPPPPPAYDSPPQRPGYTWQPGYWTLVGGQWQWVDGTWVSTNPGSAWQPSHWEQAPDGSWHFVGGRWVPAG